MGCAGSTHAPEVLQRWAVATRGFHTDRLAPWCPGTCRCPVQAQTFCPPHTTDCGVPDPSSRTVAVGLPSPVGGPLAKEASGFLCRSLVGVSDPLGALPGPHRQLCFLSLLGQPRR